MTIQNTALNLAAHNTGLNHHFRIIHARLLNCRHQLLSCVYLRDTERRTCTSRLHKHWVTQPGHTLQRPVTVMAPLAVCDHLIRANFQPGISKRNLHKVFIHTHGGGGHPAPHIGQVRHFKQTLNCAVFTERPVQEREHNINGGAKLKVPRRVYKMQPGIPRAQRQEHLLCAAGELCHVRSCGELLQFLSVCQVPAAVLGNAHRYHLVFGGIYRAKHPHGGNQRNRVLRRTPTTQ